eukprot:c20248_g1_i1 orf=426-815(+)
MLAQRERAFSRGLAAFQRLLEQRPGDQWIASQVARARAELQEIDDRRSDFRFHAQQAFWIRHGDRMGREFFRSVGQRHGGTALSCIQDPDGELHFQPDRIAEVVTAHFSSLYQAEDPTEATFAAREEVW